MKDVGHGAFAYVREDGMTGAVLAWALFTECADASGDIGSGSRRVMGIGDQRFETWRIRALLRSMPPTTVMPTRDAIGSCSSISSAMKH